MIFGYFLSAFDNDSYMYEGNKENFLTCRECGIKRMNTYNTNINIGKKSYDIGSTYDNELIVSKKFIKTLIEYNYTGMSFYPLHKYSNLFFFEVRCLPKLYVNISDSNLHIERVCKNNINHKEYFEPSQIRFKNVKHPIKEGFFRTDISFGDWGSESPEVIVGLETYSQLLNSGLKGLDMTPLDI